MNSDTDVPHQPDTIQQPPLMEKRSGPIWILIFIPLVAVNVIFFYFAGMALSQTAGGMSGIGIIPIALILVLIDFLAVFFYIKKQHPQGIAKVISYTFFIAVCLMLINVVLGIVSLLLFFLAANIG